MLLSNLDNLNRGNTESSASGSRRADCQLERTPEHWSIFETSRSRDSGKCCSKSITIGAQTDRQTDKNQARTQEEEHDGRKNSRIHNPSSCRKFAADNTCKLPNQLVVVIS